MSGPLRSDRIFAHEIACLASTCFMNSALQCMSNTKELQEYFSGTSHPRIISNVSLTFRLAAGVHKTELNRDNPLGMGGQVAEAFAQLVERIWSGNGGSVAPREFKQALSKFAPSFSGYGQQDSQELLAFLLDGIHEDLNRIKKKPGTNSPDWTGGGDKELVEMARICWEQYRSRNDSVIVDLFQGQYRSTVVCPDCSKVRSFSLVAKLDSHFSFSGVHHVRSVHVRDDESTGDEEVGWESFLRPSRSASTSIFCLSIPHSEGGCSLTPCDQIELQLPKSASVKQLKAAIGVLMDSDSKRVSRLRSSFSIFR